MASFSWPRTTRLSATRPGTIRKAEVKLINYWFFFFFLLCFDWTLTKAGYLWSGPSSVLGFSFSFISWKDRLTQLTESELPAQQGWSCSPIRSNTGKVSSERGLEMEIPTFFYVELFFFFCTNLITKLENTVFFSWKLSYQTKFRNSWGTKLKAFSSRKG